MPARPLLVIAGTALVLGAGGCGPSGNAGSSCAGGPHPPGVQAKLVTDGAFETPDVNNLYKRFYAAGAACVSVGAPGTSSVEVKVQGISRSRADFLLAQDPVKFVTWTRPAGAGPVTVSPDVVDPRFVPVAEGGTCAGSTASVECIPTGYVPHDTGVDGSMITSAKVGKDPTTGTRVVQITLSDTGASLLGQVTSGMPSAPAPENMLAIIAGAVLLNNATVQQPLANGQVQISGGAMQADATSAVDVAAVLDTAHLRAYTVTDESDLK